MEENVTGRLIKKANQNCFVLNTGNQKSRKGIHVVGIIETYRLRKETTGLTRGTSCRIEEIQDNLDTINT